MTVPTTTRTQVQAYRFGIRRLERAVSTGESYRRNLGGPRHGLSFLLGILIALLVLAGFAVVALISPEPSIGDAQVVIDSDDASVYVVRDKVLYPSLNLASALLAAGADHGRQDSGGESAGKPKVATVDGDTVHSRPKGQLLGIPGAPDRIPGESDLVDPTWTVCDTDLRDAAKSPSAAPSTFTTVALGRPGRTNINLGAYVLTRAPNGSQYLIGNGHRASVDPNDRAVALALGTAGAAPRPISLGLLNAIPAGAAVTPPSIAGFGSPAGWDDALTVGTVFDVHLAAGTRHYVALRDGAEQIGNVLADLIRADHASTASVPAVAPSVLKRAPQSSAIDVSRYPTTRPAFANTTSDPALCLTWDGRTPSGGYTVYPAVAAPLPSGARPVPAPPGSPAGTADSVAVPTGHGQVVGQVTGDQSPKTGALFLVGEQGVKYPVVNRTALGYLGLGQHVRPAPPALVNLLPTGPTLDPDEATQYYRGSSGP